MLRHCAFLLLSGLALGACAGTPEPARPAPRLLSGTAQEWTGGTAVIKAVATNRQNNYLVALGSMRSTGDFAVTLPTSVEARDSSAPFACQENETGKLEVSPSTLRVSLIEALPVAPTEKNGEPEIGELNFANRDQASGYNVTRVVQAYTPVAGTVKGTCRIDYRSAADGSDFSTETFSFDLTLAVGWNDVVRTNTSSGKDFSWAYETRTPPQGSAGVIGNIRRRRKVRYPPERSEVAHALQTWRNS